MGEDENIALVNVKEANSGCGPPVSELYRQMSRQSPKVDIFLDLTLKTFRYYVKTNTWFIHHIPIVNYFRIMPCWP